jgi:hypothetical protein
MRLTLYCQISFIHWVCKISPRSHVFEGAFFLQLSRRLITYRVGWFSNLVWYRVLCFLISSPTGSMPVSLLIWLYIMCLK